MSLLSTSERRAASTEFQGVELVGNFSTFYTDPKDVRFELVAQTVEELTTAGVPAVVVDSSHIKGHEWVGKELGRIGAVVLPAEVGGIATQRRQGADFSVRSGAKKIVSYEGEKTAMSSFISEIATKLDTHDLVSIGRTESAMASLPPVQRWTEALGGWVFQNMLQLPPDAWSGGRAFTAEGAQYLLRYPAEQEGMNNWIWLHQTLLDARADGRAVTGLEVDLQHPTAMVAEETGNPTYDRKRYEQFMLQVAWGVARPEASANDRSRAIADIVTGEMASLPANPTNEEYRASIAGIEAQLQLYV